MEISKTTIFDIFKDDALVALTYKNAIFIDGLLKVDFKIRKDELEVRKSFIELKKSVSRKSIKKVVAAVNETNSTHLSKEGMDEITEIIEKFLGTPYDLDKLIDEIKKPIFKKGEKDFNEQCLFYKLCQKINSGEKKPKTSNPSFASKFYFYANKYLNDNSSFSKYDRIVAEKVAIYEQKYGAIASKSKKKYVIPSGSQDVKYNGYIDYLRAINRILEKLKEDPENELTAEQFDNIVWYTNR